MERDSEPSGGERGGERAKMNHKAVLCMIDVIDEWTKGSMEAFCPMLYCLRPVKHPGDHYPTRSMVEA